MGLCLARESSSVAVTWSSSHHGSEQHRSLVVSIPGRQTSMCKGPEARMSSVCLMMSKEAYTLAEWQELGKRSRGLDPSSRGHGSGPGFYLHER